MVRPTGGVGHQPPLWLLFILRVRRCFKLRYLLFVFFGLVVFTYVRLKHNEPFDRAIDSTNKRNALIGPPDNDAPQILDKCNFEGTEWLLRYQSAKAADATRKFDDTRAQPTLQRLHTLFKILISSEEKYRPALDYLGIFRFTDLYNTLRPFANNSRRLHEIYCQFQHYITRSDNGHLDIAPSLLVYLKQLSVYLSDGFTSEHATWNRTSLLQSIVKPVIILGANSRFYDTLQASMRTVNEFLSDHSVAIYDLGFDANQVTMVRSAAGVVRADDEFEA